MTSLTQKRLRELLDYNPRTGVFTWRDNQIGPIKAGMRAGTIDKLGYCYIKIAQKSYPASGLAFLWMDGQRPREVDHINRNPRDNRWKNLRIATRSQQMGNSRGRTILPKGVHKLTNGRFRAGLHINDRFIYLGNFSTPEEASAAYMKAAQKYFGEFARAF